MDIRVLEYFLAVAREQTISGAAQALHMTQPPLSKQLKELEEELGKQLLIRGARRVTLTREGMLLRERAQQIVELMEKTRAEVSASGREIAGDVYLGGGESEGMRLIAQTIRQVQREHPQVRFHFFSGDAYDVTERLDRGLIDFGTLIEPVDLSKYDSIRLPRPDVWGLLMRRDSPLAQKEAVTPADLLGLPLLLSRQQTGENGLAGWLGYSVEKLQTAATGNLVYNLRLLAEEGAGYALTLDRLSPAGPDSPLCFRPLEPRLNPGCTWPGKNTRFFLRRRSCCSRLCGKILQKILKIRSLRPQKKNKRPLTIRINV